MSFQEDYKFLYDEAGRFSVLDDIPVGWRSSFVTDLCIELRQVLMETGELEDYRVLQVKEKFGGLRWYDNCANDRVREVISKYEKLSFSVCANCGAPAIGFCSGWSMPVCKACTAKFGGRRDN